MTHVVHPYSHRLGIIKDWRSRWFGLKSKFTEYLKSDVLLREYLEKRLKGMHVGYVEIERNAKILRVIIGTSRPGAIIGRSGEGSVKLRADIEKEMRRLGIRGKEDLAIDIEEVRSPESNALIVAQIVAEGLEKRMPFRRVLKQTIEKVMANRDVKGVRIKLSGRLGGADMARREQLMKGRIPLQTLRSDIDFARYRAKIAQGDLGIKVWIYRGDIFENKK